MSMIGYRKIDIRHSFMNIYKQINDNMKKALKMWYFYFMVFFFWFFGMDCIARERLTIFETGVSGELNVVYGPRNTSLNICSSSVI